MSAVPDQGSAGLPGKPHPAKPDPTGPPPTGQIGQITQIGQPTPTDHTRPTGPAHRAAGRRALAGGPLPQPDDSWQSADGTVTELILPRYRRRGPVIAAVLVVAALAAVLLGLWGLGATAPDRAAPAPTALADPDGAGAGADTPPDAIGPAASGAAASVPAASGAAASGAGSGAGSGAAQPGAPGRANSTAIPTPTAPAPAGTTAPAFKPFTGIIVAGAGTCLDDNNNVVADGNFVKTYACNGTSAQTWTFGVDRTLRVHNLCLHPEVSPPAASGTKMAIYTCGANAFEGWQTGPNGSLVNSASRLCLTDPVDPNAGGRVYLAPCDGTAQQRWTLT